MTSFVRKPDLSVYYDLAKPFERISVDTNGFISEKKAVPLFSDMEVTKPIGDINFNRDIAYRVVTGTLTLTLPFGSLCAQNTSTKAMFYTKEESSLNIYTQFLPNEVIIYTILSGNGDFICSKGYVTITTDDTLLRRVDVWLDNVVPSVPAGPTSGPTGPTGSNTATPDSTEALLNHTPA